LCASYCSTFVPGRRWLATHVGGRGTAGRGVVRSPCRRFWVDGVWVTREPVTNALGNHRTRHPKIPFRRKIVVLQQSRLLGHGRFRRTFENFSKKKCPLAVRPKLRLRIGDGCQACVAAFETRAHGNYTGGTHATHGIYRTVIVSYHTGRRNWQNCLAAVWPRFRRVVECRPAYILP